MYPAIKHTTDHIAQQAFEQWLQGGDHTATIDKLCQDHNVTDWVSTVRQTLTQLINDHHFNSKLS